MAMSTQEIVRATVNELGDTLAGKVVSGVQAAYGERIASLETSQESQDREIRDLKISSRDHDEGISEIEATCAAHQASAPKGSIAPGKRKKLDFVSAAKYVGLGSVGIGTTLYTVLNLAGII